MFSVDKYLGKSYNASRYNCLHFTEDVWLDLTGVNIHCLLIPVLDPATRLVTKHLFRSFRHLENPIDPCLVFMVGSRTVGPHVGVYLRGKVLHLTVVGAEFQPLEVASRTHNRRVRFYLPW